MVFIKIYLLVINIQCMNFEVIDAVEDVGVHAVFPAYIVQIFVASLSL